MSKKTQPQRIYEFLKNCPNKTANRVEIGQALYVIDVPKAISLFNKEATINGRDRRIEKISTSKNGTANYQLFDNEPQYKWIIEGETAKQVRI